MVAGIEDRTARKYAVDSWPDDDSLRRASGLGLHESDCAEVTCTFCYGKGTHPFGIMSWLPTGCVCKGSGIVHAQASQESYAHNRNAGLSKGSPASFMSN